MNIEKKPVQLPKAEARPAEVRSGDKKAFVRPELKRQGSIEKVTGFTF